MIRIRIATSHVQDPDVEAQLAAIDHLPRTSIDSDFAPLKDNLALIVRQATQLIGGRRAGVDVMLSVGEYDVHEHFEARAKD